MYCVREDWYMYSLYERTGTCTVYERTGTCTVYERIGTCTVYMRGLVHIYIIHTYEELQRRSMTSETSVSCATSSSGVA